MTRHLAGVLFLVLAGQTAQAADFDDRWFASGHIGGAVTDQEESDSGFAGYFAVGKTLYPRFSVEGELEFLDISITDLGVDYTRLGGGIKASYDFVRSGRVAVAAILGASVREIDFLGVQQTGFGAFTGLNLRTKLDGNFDFLAELRYLVDPVDAEGPIREDVYYAFTGTVGVRYNFGQWPPPPPDSDGDGVPDSIDQCPNTPPGVIVNELGCAIDTDGDGVPDYRDRCPNTPLGVLVDEYGCPLDSDGDGVIDPLDKCPNTPKGVPVDAEGCPLDSDLDGVLDNVDLCPGTPFGAEVDINGCPFDTDQDGVPDFRDDCPNTPYGVPVNERGCSTDLDGDGVLNDADLCPNTFPGLEVDKTGCPLRNQTLVLYDVHFEFDKSNLLPDSRQLLARVAKSLNDQPDIQIEVGGHTDSLGSDAYNQSLSERRAASVASFLARENVPAANIVSIGYGESQPVADNDTEEGRELNRRVEIKLLN